MKMNISKLILFWVLWCFAVCQDQIMWDASIILPDRDSHGEKSIDFDDISLHYYLPNGIKGGTGGCTPDGYWLVPVDAGIKEFVLKVSGPSGAVFEPEEHNVNLKENSSACEGKLKFKLVGFGIQSKVVIKSAQDTVYSPFNCLDEKTCQLSISLVLKKTNKVVDTAKTDRNGSFKFASVSPGKYTMKVAPKDGIAFSVDHVDCEINIGTDQDCNTKVLEVRGFMIKGRALSYEEPLDGVTVKLSDKSNKEIDSSITDSNGEYRFDNVPSGRYSLKASIVDSKVKFKIEQSEIQVEVRDGITIVDQAFVVSGFSIIGKVINTKGYGIKDVTVKIDGQVKAVTNDKGNYKLDEIVPGSYILEGVHENMLFEPMQVTISPQSKVIPELVVSEYKLCGRISIENISEFTSAFGDNRRVLLKDKQGHQERILLVDNEEGKFCFDVKPHEYVITPVVTTDEKEMGLSFKPSSISVQVVDQPVTNLLFKQVKYSASGSVEWKEEGQWNNIEITIENDKGYHKKIIYQGGSYTIDNILPGKYTATVDKPEFCWKSESVKFTIDDASDDSLITIPTFVNTGYSIKYNSNDDIDVEIGLEGENRRPEKVKFFKGSNTHCYNKQGTIQIIPKSCYKYEKEFYTWKYNECNIDFVPVSYQVKGSILFDSEKDAKKSEVSITETTKNGDKKELILKLNKEYNSIYSFEYYASENSVLSFEPKSTVTDESKLLFYPISKEVKINHECISDFNEIRFESRKGLNLKGYVEGNITDVNIIVRIKGTQQIIHEEVNKDGNFNIGPLYDTEQYEIDISKDGYNIFPHKSKQGVFTAEILSYMTLKFVDEDNNKPISNVLVVVSSGSSYKNNSYSDDSGVVQFPDLYSGKYYLRPMLKEFKFDTVSLDIKEGERIEKTIKGKRTAFSAYGSITLITGDPIPNVVVQAQSMTTQHLEEAVTNKDGSYRIMGLSKDSKYQIKIKDNEDINEGHQQIQKSIPNSKVIEVADSDSMDVNFMALLPPSKFYISGFVNYEEDKKSLDGGKVELFVKGKEDAPASRQKIGMSRLFTFSGLPLNRDYIIKVIPRTEEGKTYHPLEIEVSSNEIRRKKQDHIYIEANVKRVVE